MRNLVAATVCVLLMPCSPLVAQSPGGTGVDFENPLIDSSTFLQHVAESHKLRQSRLLSEAEFIKAASEEGVVVLDARSANWFRQLHIKNAVSLPFTEFTESNLQRLIPNKNTKILIYCNNNVADSPIVFASKEVSAALNLSTFTSLYSYGYKNVYELGPLLSLKTTRIEFEGELRE